VRSERFFLAEAECAAAGQRSAATPARVRCRDMVGDHVNFAPLLHSELAHIDEHFAPDELAFLALTSKVELPIRDRLAYGLFRRLPAYRVAREWKRVDLAVLSGDAVPVPLMLLEAKALYTFDLVGNDAWVARYPAKVEQDVEKLRTMQSVTSDTEFFALVLATHPTGAIGSGLRQVAKYSSGIAKAINARGDAAAVADEARRYVQSRLKDFGPIHAGAIEGGEAYGVRVEIHYSLLGPIAHRRASVGTA
jgi:hypothetical protein